MCLIKSVRVVLIFLICFPATLPAQTVPAPTNWLIVKFSPQHLAVNGIHVEVEKSIGQGQQSLAFSPRFYHGGTHTADAYTGRKDDNLISGEVTGYGAELQHRLYFSKTPDVTQQQFYFAYGVNAHQFNLDYEAEGWTEEMKPNGLKYYTFKPLPYTEKIKQWGAVAMLGWQEPFIKQRVLFDFYLGAGYKNSDISTTNEAPRYNVNIYDYGYSGLYFLSGLKLGILFGK